MVPEIKMQIVDVNGILVFLQVRSLREEVHGGVLRPRADAQEPEGGHREGGQRRQVGTHPRHAGTTGE